jgi:pimeloyl-ACP methyl ester carboxylesterase
MGNMMAGDHNRPESAFLTVNGVSLHYLDWGGAGKHLLFLPGLGDSAHIFDDIAPELTVGYHVLGLTRRGQGHSEIPRTGYDTATLAEDLHQFLNQLQIQRVSLIGHSLAGSEMTYFAGRHPERVEHLIYLDANYDATDAGKLNDTLPLPYPVFDATPPSVSAYRAWLQKHMYGGLWTRALEANLRDTLDIAEDETFRDWMPDQVAAALRKGVLPHPDYALIQAPVLAFFAIKDHFPGLEDQDEAMREKIALWMAQVGVPLQRAAVKRLQERLPQAQLVELMGVTHYFFIDKSVPVVQQIGQFLEVTRAARE